jgi:hypothetical protein
MLSQLAFMMTSNLDLLFPRFKVPPGYLWTIKTSTPSSQQAKPYRLSGPCSESVFAEQVFQDQGLEDRLVLGIGEGSRAVSSMPGDIFIKDLFRVMLKHCLERADLTLTYPLDSPKKYLD